MVQKQKQKEEPSPHQAQVLVQGLPPKVSCQMGQMQLQGQMQGRLWRLKALVLEQELGQLPEVISCQMGQMQQQGRLQGQLWRLTVLVLGLVQGLQPRAAFQKELRLLLEQLLVHLWRLKVLVLGQELGQLPEVISCQMGQMQQQGQ